MAGAVSARPIGLRRRIFARGIAMSVAAATLTLVLGALPAAAQTDFLTFPAKPPSAKSSVASKPAKGAQSQMLVQANEIHYDHANDMVSAVGNVQMYYNGSTIEADKVIYNQKTKRLRAEGRIRLTEADGKITYGDILDLSDDYRDGFVDSLRLDSADNTRFAAARADQIGRAHV